MPERQFLPFDPALAELMRAAFHDACAVLRDCTEEERAVVASHIIRLVQDGERDQETITRCALEMLRE